MTEPRNPTVRLEEDVLPARTIAMVAIVLLLICAFLGGWAWLILREREQTLRPGRVFPERELGPPREVEGVQQVIFDYGPFGLRLAAERRRFLETWGWVDEERGLVRIPVERAMELLAEEPR
jgi:hypothetical protein